MAHDPVRSRIMELIAHRNPPTDLKRASLACGKNHAYLHQFVHRGTPKRLPEDARYALASHLGVDEMVLRDMGLRAAPRDSHPDLAPPQPGDSCDPVGGGGLISSPGNGLTGAGLVGGGLADGGVGNGLISVPELTAQDVLRDGSLHATPAVRERWCFPVGWVAHVLKARPAALRLITVEGGAMEPALRPGDRLLIDTAQRRASPPGLFILYDGIGLIPRNLEFVPNSDPATVVLCTPDAGAREVEVSPDALCIVGRAIWHARCL